MTREECKTILTMLRVNYPQSFVNLTKEDSVMLLDQYEMSFRDDDVNLVTASVQYYVNGDVRHFAPNIAEIRQAMNNLLEENNKSEYEAWNEVKDALKNSNYGANEEFEKLDDKIKLIVGSPSTLREWAMMDTNELDQVIGSNFMRSYRTVRIRENTYKALPRRLKEVLQLTRNSDTGMLTFGEVKNDRTCE